MGLSTGLNNSEKNRVRLPQILGDFGGSGLWRVMNTQTRTLPSTSYEL